MEFTKEISYISKTMAEDGWVEQSVKKTVRFKELSRTDPEQRDLCWLVMDIWDLKGKSKKFRLSRDVMSELTDMFIDKMVILDENFTESDKKEFLADNGAVITFGLWLVHNRIADFFFKLTTT